MGTDIVAIKDELHSQRRVEIFRDVLSPYRLPVEAWRAGFIAGFENERYLLDNCDLQSIVNSATTIAVLGLRMDKATGQSCVVPFAGKAQPIVMVQGYTVIAGRGGFMMQSYLVHEGDQFDELRGTTPGILHKPNRDNPGKTIGTYAIARSQHHPVVFTPFMSLDEVIAVRDRSKGYQSAKSRNRSHPWMTDFEAMMLKTPKRRLQKDIPNDQLAQAAWLDTQHDLGNVAWLNPKTIEGGKVIATPMTIEGVEEGSGPFPARQPPVTDVTDLTEAPRKPAPLIWKLPDGTSLTARNAEHWSATIVSALNKQADNEKLKAALDRNRGILNDVMRDHPDHANAIFKVFADRGIN